MIVAAGEALVDLVAKEGEPLVAVPGGGPFNAARAIARLGMPCSFLGALSSDRFGRSLEAALRADGVGLDLVQRTDLPTTIALAELNESGAATYRFYVDGTSAPTVHPFGGLPRDTSALLVGTLGLVLEPVATTLDGVVEALDEDTLLMIDPNARPSATFDPVAWRSRMDRMTARADIVKASTEDLAFLRPGGTPLEAAADLEARGARVVVVTDGAAPVDVRMAGRVHRIETRPVDVIDTVGAGDTFAAALLSCIVHDGGSRADLGDTDLMLRAVRFAIRASAATCQQRGAVSPTLADLGGWPH